MKIGLTGDVMIGRLVNENLDRVSETFLWGDMLPFLRGCDLNLINLEAALTTSDQIAQKVFNFKADPHKVKTLVEGSIDVVNLANNHTLDYSEEGLLETLSVLDKVGIAYVGAGKNIDEARGSVILSKKGVRVGILGYTDNEPSWEATDHDPGTRYISITEAGLETVKQDVGTLRDQVDILIVTIHWGPNMRERPPPHFISFAHQLIDCGVDLFHGHSAHIFQGVETYKGKYILYDTGDFVDDYFVDPILRNDRSFFFIATVEKKEVVELRLIPTLIKQFQVNCAKGIDAEETIRRMHQLSSEFGTRFSLDNGELVVNKPLAS